MRTGWGCTGENPPIFPPKAHSGHRIFMLEGKIVQQGACTAPSRWSFPTCRGYRPSPENKSNSEVFGVAMGQWVPTTAGGRTTLTFPSRQRKGLVGLPGEAASGQRPRGWAALDFAAAASCASLCWARIRNSALSPLPPQEREALLLAEVASGLPRVGCTLCRGYGGRR